MNCIDKLKKLYANLTKKGTWYYEDGYIKATEFSGKAYNPYIFGGELSEGYIEHDDPQMKFVCEMHNNFDLLVNGMSENILRGVPNTHLTKRELVAAMLLQGMMMREDFDAITGEAMISNAIGMTDILIDELQKSPPTYKDQGENKGDSKSMSEHPTTGSEL